MTFADERYNRIRYTVGIIMVLFWVVYAIATLADVELLYNSVSPIVSFTAAFLIWLSRDEIGHHWSYVRWIMFGIFCWFIGDIFWFIDATFMSEGSVFGIIADKCYLFPDYFFLGGLIGYVKANFRRNDFMITIIDCFMITVIAFDIMQRWLEVKDPDYRINIETLNTILYFFVTVFLLTLILVVMMKIRHIKHTVGFYIFSIAISFHTVLELRYTYLLLRGTESESAYLDILYLLFMVVYSGSLSYGRLKNTPMQQISQMDNPDSFLHKNFRKLYWAESIFVFLIGVVLYALGFLKERDTYFFVMLILGYIILCKTLQTNMLSEELLRQQKDENERLERMVEEKTRELREMNMHLEHISNTDVLTGLFNRRYGIGYVEELVKEAENYPIAVYSLDLNFFKPINDNYGHEMGDVVLKEVGHRLNSLKQDRCTAIRVGGDEFLVIFRNASTAAAVENVGRLICDRMDEPIEAHVISSEKGEQDHTFQISASIGVALYPADTMDLDTLFRMADQALYAIKHTHEKSAFLLYSRLEEKDKL